MAQKAKKSVKVSLKDALELIRKGKDLSELSRLSTYRALARSGRRISRQNISSELRSVRTQLMLSALKKHTPIQRRFHKMLYGKSPAAYGAAFRRIEHASSFAMSIIDKAESELYHGKETFKSLGITANDLRKLREKVWLREARSYLAEMNETSCDSLLSLQAAGRIAQLVREMKVDMRKLGASNLEGLLGDLYRRIRGVNVYFENHYRKK